MSETVYQARVDKPDRVIIERPYSMFTAGDDFTKELCETAIQNWN